MIRSFSTLFPALGMWRRLAGVNAKPYGWPSASLDPAPDDADQAAAGSWDSRSKGPGMLGRDLGLLMVGRKFDGLTFPIFVGKQVVIEHIFE